MSAESESVVKAKQQLKRALTLYKGGDKTGALKALGSALELDMTLRYDDEVRKFAGKITGLPPDEAVDKLGSFYQRTAIIEKKRKPMKASGGVSGRSLLIGVFVALVFTAIGLLFFVSEVVPRLAENLTGRVEKRVVAEAGNLEYYVAYPGGLPPETGWPTLVLVHGMGMNGKTMADAFQPFAAAGDVLVIAPTFPNMPYGQYRDDGSDFFLDGRFIMQIVMADLQYASYQSPDAFSSYLGQVYFGYAEGADFVSYPAEVGLDYADAGFALEGPIGVVLANGYYEYQPNFYQPYFITDAALTPEVLGQAVGFTQQMYRQ